MLASQAYTEALPGGQQAADPVGNGLHSGGQILSAPSGPWWWPWPSSGAVSVAFEHLDAAEDDPRALDRGAAWAAEMERACMHDGPTGRFDRRWQAIRHVFVGAAQVANRARVRDERHRTAVTPLVGLADHIVALDRRCDRRLIGRLEEAAQRARDAFPVPR